MIALRMALRFFGFEITTASLVSKLQKLGLKVTKEGVFLPYLAILANMHGFNTLVRYPLSILNEIKVPLFGQVVLRHSHLCEVKLSKCSDRFYLYESIKYCIAHGIKVTVYSNRKPNFNHIKRAIKNNGAVIVQISCRDFYQLKKENWLHFLTLIPHNNRFLVLDGYRKRGRIYYGKKWEQCIRAADMYDWKKWHNALIEIYPQKPLH